MEVRERGFIKRKRGVYRQTWKGKTYNANTSSLRKQIDDLHEFESAPLAVSCCCRRFCWWPRAALMQLIASAV